MAKHKESQEKIKDTWKSITLPVGWQNDKNLIKTLYPNDPDCPVITDKDGKLTATSLKQKQGKAAKFGEKAWEEISKDFIKNTNDLFKQVYSDRIKNCIPDEIKLIPNKYVPEDKAYIMQDNVYVNSNLMKAIRDEEEAMYEAWRNSHL